MVMTVDFTRNGPMAHNESYCLRPLTIMMFDGGAHDIDGRFRIDYRQHRFSPTCPPRVLRTSASVLILYCLIDRRDLVAAPSAARPRL
jgi:hypothetical protein